MIPNVSCERCHGPGRAHVEAARRGAPESELSLPLGPDRWTAAELLRFCGECHRHPAGPRPEPDPARRPEPGPVPTDRALAVAVLPPERGARSVA